MSEGVINRQSPCTRGPVSAETEASFREGFTDGYRRCLSDLWRLWAVRGVRWPEVYSHLAEFWRVRLLGWRDNLPADVMLFPPPWADAGDGEYPPGLGDGVRK